MYSSELSYTWATKKKTGSNLCTNANIFCRVADPDLRGSALLKKLDLNPDLH